MPDEIKFPLGGNQFAINKHAAFENKSHEAVVKFDPETQSFDLELKLTYKLKNSTDLQIGPSNDVRFKKWGLFKKNSSNNFVKGGFSNILIDFTDDNRVALQSEEADLNLVTDGEKGEHGHSFVEKSSPKFTKKMMLIMTLGLSIYLFYASKKSKR